MAFLPVNRSDMEQRGWEELDFLFITGDAYVDHPSFGTAILTRILEKEGYQVGVCAQPDIHDSESLKIMGVPRYGVFISSGVVDSMVDNYTAGKRKRHDDRYSAGGAGGKRPDRALIRYSNMVREQLGEIPLVIGGIEASLRRFAHYDYWSDKVRRSILQDARADILIYGMGEKPIVEVARLLAKGANVKKITSIRGTCVFVKKEYFPKTVFAFMEPLDGYRFADKKYTTEQLRKNVLPQNDKCILLPSYDEVNEDKTAYAAAFKAQYEEQDPASGKILIQQHSERFVIQNPPQEPMSAKEMDAVYALPYERTYHPMYAAMGGVPSIEEVKFSITSQRGCFGGCHFCAITFHQGRIIQHRSPASIVEEAKIISKDPEFKGYIHDVGGPTANFYNPACDRQKKGSVCKNRACLFPQPCPNLKVDHTDYLDVLRKVRAVDGVKKVFIRSGIRFDYVMADRKTNFLEELCKNHVSGQLKVAPEHLCDDVLKLMGKPGHAVYEEFKEAYQTINKRLGKNQFLVPYLISGHPGCTLKNAIELAVEIKKSHVMPEQVQDFYPTPGTVSTTMYYTGINPLTFETIHVPDEREKGLQRALLQFSKPENRPAVERALAISKRQDLIGYGPDCLLRPYRTKRKKKENDEAETPETISGGNTEKTESDNRKPKTASRRPDAANRRPDTANRRPDAANKRPDAANKRPNAANRRSDAATKRSDATGRKPDAAGRKPDGFNERPDRTGKPGNKTANPDFIKRDYRTAGKNINKTEEQGHGKNDQRKRDGDTNPRGDQGGSRKNTFRKR